MPTLYLTEDRALVRRDSEDCLLVQMPEQRTNDGTITATATKRRLPLIKIEQVVVLGEVTFTASALHLLLEKRIEVHFLTQLGQYKGALYAAATKNAPLRLSQHRIHHDIPRRSELARQFVIGKIANQRVMLQRANRRREETPFSQSIEQIAETIRTLHSLDCSQQDGPLLSTGDTGITGTVLASILGLEGAASARYFRHFGELLSDPQTWPFPGRVRRPPTDPVNALLSYGYAILTSQMGSAVQIVGLDPFVGYLHSSAYGRPALALDLMEEFRPIIVDSVVLKLLNNKMLKPDDFSVELGAYRLKKEPRKLFLTALEERLHEELLHPIFGYKTSYRRCLELQARLLGKYLTGEIPAYPPLILR